MLPLLFFAAYKQISIQGRSGNSLLLQESDVLLKKGLQIVQGPRPWGKLRGKSQLPRIDLQGLRTDTAVPLKASFCSPSKYILRLGNPGTCTPNAGRCFVARRVMSSDHLSMPQHCTLAALQTFLSLVQSTDTTSASELFSYSLARVSHVGAIFLQCPHLSLDVSQFVGGWPRYHINAPSHNNHTLSRNSSVPVISTYLLLAMERRTCVMKMYGARMEFIGPPGVRNRRAHDTEFRTILTLQNRLCHRR